MALSFKYLLEIVENETIFLYRDQERRWGGFRWKGPHFPVLVRYVLSLRFRNHERFSDLLEIVEKPARLSCEAEDSSKQHFYASVFLDKMQHAFLPKLGEFFAVPKAQQLLSDTTPERNEIIAAFIEFLVEAVEAFLGQNLLSRDITAWIDALLEELKFLLLVLRDTPFRCTQVKQTKNILAEIESIANQAGLFTHSFFFMANFVRDPEIVAALFDLLPKFMVTTEKIKRHCMMPSLTVSPVGDTQRVRIALSFKYLLQIVESKTLFLGLDLVRRRGGFRWKGPHFPVFVRYVLNLRFYCNHERFSELLKRVEESAYLCCETKNFLSRHINSVKFLEMMETFLPELRECFTVPRSQRLFFDTTPKRNELVAAFINFLVEAIEAFLGQKYLTRFITAQINPLLEDLKFLVFILGDTPFRCTQLEETKSILAEIESIANQAGLFLHSSFFTIDRIKDRKIVAVLSDLIPKFKMAKEKIKQHCITFSKLPNVKIPNTGLVSIFIVDSVLDYLNHLINNEARLIVEVKDQITTLHKELHLSRSFLGDIEVKQDEDLIKQAIQLRDLAYEAEYILTWFVTGDVPIWYIVIRLSIFIQTSKLIRTAIPETKLNYGINSPELVQSRSQVSSHISNSIQKDEEIIVGLNDETMQIASQLVGGPEHLQIISITGMPGLGKTTLAKKLYNHSSVVNRFDQRLWCVVSQRHQRTSLLRDILSSVPKFKEDKSLEEEKEDSKLGEYLYKTLKGRRYLIVMDDIWDIQAWNDVKIYFPKDSTGSKVLFTTRNGHLASEASSDAIINELHLQSADQCWNLLQHMVFRKSIFPPKFEYIGKQIAASCKGLPLAVVGIAAVLANTDMHESSWHKVSESLTSYISKDQDILELSYNHLPIHLKPCFLYFSAFKEDMEIPVKKLLSLWISEGFIPANMDKRSEDIAEKYLIELINRNMVQVAKIRSDNGVKACRVHDLMHDMALRIAEQEKFLNVIEKGFSLYKQHHHLCNHPHYLDIISRPLGLHIRSLFGISMSSSNALCLRLAMCLRVLQCGDINILEIEDTSQDPSSYIFTSQCPLCLVQLRYLEIPYFPLQMPSRTENLEFLILTTETSIDPSFFHYTPKLRQLEFKDRSSFSKNLEFSQHYCLETLSGVELHNSTDEDILRCFPNLRRLKCYYDFHWNQGVDVSFLSQLESLSMTFLFSLKVNFRAMNFSTNIKKLSIHHGSFEMMSLIGKLPNLEILKLALLYFEGGNWTTNDDEFQKLKLLKLNDVSLENWITPSEDHFPMLERLVLENFEYLKGIPLELGYIPTLQAIEVHSCGKSVEESALEIQKRQQEECGNEEMLVIINGYTHRS